MSMYNFDCFQFGFTGETLVLIVPVPGQRQHFTCQIRLLVVVSYGGPLQGLPAHPFNAHIFKPSEIVCNQFE